MKQKQYIITKKIAKQGRNSIIVIPRFLQEDLKGGTVVKLTIDIIRGKNE